MEREEGFFTFMFNGALACLLTAASTAGFSTVGTSFFSAPSDGISDGILEGILV
ncbi:MAG: hypothetical protein LBQ84_07575 [Flavobacteriaceae bacterium]|nr:hypothetical protein [Flavobacteriaceae bacterium]